MIYNTQGKPNIRQYVFHTDKKVYGIFAKTFNSAFILFRELDPNTDVNGVTTADMKIDALDLAALGIRQSDE